MKNNYIDKLILSSLLLATACCSVLGQEAGATATTTGTVSVSDTPEPPPATATTYPAPPPAPPGNKIVGEGGASANRYSSGMGGGSAFGYSSGMGGGDTMASMPYKPFDNDRQGSLIVMTKDTPTPEKNAAMTDDLSIMFRLLQKTMQSKIGEVASPEAMNIPILSLPGQNNIRNMYLQDYGALFFLKVSMPLIRTSEPGKNDKSKEDDAWEQTRQELDSSRYPSDIIRQRYGMPASEFNEPKVAALQSSLIANLKYASNMQWIKPDEWIVVVVTGAGSNSGDPFQPEISAGEYRMSPAMMARYGLKPKEKSKDKNEEIAADKKAPRVNTGKKQTLMVVKALKSDVDAFSSGKLSFEEFKAKTTVQSY